MKDNPVLNPYATGPNIIGAIGQGAVAGLQNAMQVYQFIQNQQDNSRRQLMEQGKLTADYAKQDMQAAVNTGNPTLAEDAVRKYTEGLRMEQVPTAGFELPPSVTEMAAKIDAKNAGTNKPVDFNADAYDTKRGNSVLELAGGLIGNKETTETVDAGGEKIATTTSPGRTKKTVRTIQETPSAESQLSAKTQLAAKKMEIDGRVAAAEAKANTMSSMFPFLAMGSGRGGKMGASNGGIDADLAAKIVGQVEERTKMLATNWDKMPHGGNEQFDANAIRNEAWRQVQAEYKQLGIDINGMLSGGAPLDGGSQNVSIPQVYKQIVTQSSQLFGVPVPVAASLFQMESGWNAAARSSAGALGVAQFMPATAAAIQLPGKKTRGIDPLNPAEAIPGGMIYLRQGYDQAKSLGVKDEGEAWAMALAGYQAGHGRIAQAIKANGPTWAGVAKWLDDKGIGDANMLTTKYATTISGMASNAQPAGAQPQAKPQRNPAIDQLLEQGKKRNKILKGGK